jgi:prevent-host-death family protein
MQSTYARPVRDLRNNYSEILDLANEGNQVIITRGGREAAVVIGVAEFRDYEAYVHRAYINSELAKAKKQAQDPVTKWLTEEEFWMDEI